MINLNELARGGTLCLSKAGLQLGTTDDKDVDIAAPNGAGVDFAINGLLYHKADTDSAPITAGHVIPTLCSAVILLLLATDGTLTSLMSNTPLTGSGVPMAWPTPTVNTCPIGYLKVVNASGASWTSGADEFDAASVTTTYHDIFTVPVAPLVA